MNDFATFNMEKIREKKASGNSHCKALIDIIRYY